MESLDIFCSFEQMNTLCMYMAMLALLNGFILVWRNYAIGMFKGFSIVS
jgi:hypothetical protein